MGTLCAALFSLAMFPSVKSWRSVAEANEGTNASSLVTANTSRGDCWQQWTKGASTRSEKRKDKWCCKSKSDCTAPWEHCGNSWRDDGCCKMRGFVKIDGWTWSDVNCDLWPGHRRRGGRTIKCDKV